MGGNEALDTNSGVGPQANLAITRHGSDWYFTVCALMGFATLVFMGMSFTKPQSHRLFHYITALITLVAGIAYFSMGSGLGQTPVLVEFVRLDSPDVAAAGTREFFYVRYIDWFVTTPLLLLDLLLTAGMPWPTILVTILADEVMIVAGLVGALTPTSFKWGYWAFGMFAFFYVIYTLVWNARRNASALGGAVAQTYLVCGVLTIFVWFLYPIAWGLAEGGNVIHPDGEAVFYGVLDIIAKPVFGFMLLLGHRNIDPATIGLHLREPGALPGKHNGAQMEQHGTGVTTGSGTGATSAAQPATAQAAV